MRDFNAKVDGYTLVGYTYGHGVLAPENCLFVNSPTNPFNRPDMYVYVLVKKGTVCPIQIRENFIFIDAKGWNYPDCQGALEKYRALGFDCDLSRPGVLWINIIAEDFAFLFPEDATRLLINKKM